MSTVTDMPSEVGKTKSRPHAEDHSHRPTPDNTPQIFGNLHRLAIKSAAPYRVTSVLRGTPLLVVLVTVPVLPALAASLSAAFSTLTSAAIS